MTTTVLVRWCTTCRADVAFERPDCLDGHDGDCPELVCVECGDAVLVGVVPADPAPLFHHPAAHVA
jgi:hypothetical protein